MPGGTQKAAIVTELSKLMRISHVEGPIPEDPHDSDESDDLAGLADDLDVLELVQEERQVERDDGEQVNLVN